MKRIILSFLLVITSLASYAYDFAAGVVNYTIISNGSSGTAYVESVDGSYCPYELSIPQTVTTARGDTYRIIRLGSRCFSGCSRLKHLTIPASVYSIESSAFEGCSNLETVEQEGYGSVKDLGKSAFSGCKNLETLHISIGVENLLEKTFYGCEKLKLIDELYVGSSIGDRAFYNCSLLPSSCLTISDHLTSIGDYAFFGCSGLTSFDRSNHVESIGIYAFYGCSGLTSIDISNYVESIGTYAFYGCSGLTSLAIGKAVKNIGSYAFASCSSLSSIVVPNSVTSIGDYAFKDCSGLTSVTIGNSVTSIGVQAFSGCSELQKAEFASIESLCKIIFVHMNSNPLYLAHHLYISGEEVKDLVIPNSVTSIGFATFCNCSDLTSVTVPNSVKSIGKSAFNRCSSLTSIALPNSVTSLGEYAFRGCLGITSITVPNSVESIGANTFLECSNLKVLTCLAENVPQIGTNAFSGTEYSTAGTLYVPQSSLEAYKAAEQWKDWKNIQPVPIFVSGITLNIASKEIKVGESFTLSATVLPKDATNKSVRWSSSDTKVAIVDAATGEVTAVGAGTATITATATDGSGVTRTCVIKVFAPVSSITLNLTTKEINIGESFILTATVLPEDATEKTVTWSSSDTNVATVNAATGEVTAVGQGTATITATAADGSGVKGTCTVIVPIDTTPRPTSGNYMYVEKQTVKPGQAVQIPVELVVDEQYEEEIVGFQCNIKLPEGFDFVKNAKGNVVITLNQDRIDGHSVSSMLKADGSLNIGCASMNLGAFIDLDGAIMYVSVMAKEGMADGEYAMQISNIRLSTEDEEIQCPTITQALEVKNFTLGDLNDDGDWTILDVTLTIKHMLEETYTEAGDMNGDGSITILDVTKVIQYMLNEGPVEAASAPAARKMAKIAAKDSQKLYAENLYIEPGTQQTLTVNAHLNTEDYVGCQLEMQLPEGFSYVTNKKGNVVVTPNSYRCETHSAAVLLVDSRTLRVGLSSMSLDPIYFGEDGDEALFTVKVQADASVEAGNHEITITKIRFSTEEEEDQLAATEGYFRAFGVEPISLVVPEGGYATICLPYEATLPTGLKAYKATGIKDGMVVLEEQGNIAACTPLVIQGTAGTYNFSGDNSGAEEFEYSVGSLKSSLIPAECNQGYVLQNLSKGLGFYKIKDALTVPAFRSVLEGAAVNFAPAFVPVGFDEDATAISSVETAVKNGSAIYTLDGKRVKTMEKGKIYIVGGVKMMVK